jgi:hypothetical protein
MKKVKDFDDLIKAFENDIDKKLKQKLEAREK